MTRRELIGGLAALAAPITSVRAGQRGAGGGSSRPVHSVTGPIAADALGITLMHEHVLVDFAGADVVNPARYNADEAFRVILPHLTAVKAHGCATFVECTPAYLGRDVRLLKRLAEASGLTILTNTGYYGAARDKHVPAHAFQESDEQLAARWTREAEQGIEGTGIRPAFMKISVDEAPLPEIDAKLVRAAAFTSRRTGLPIASHTGTGAAAAAQLAILHKIGVPASRFIWVHAQSERDTAYHVKVARAGAWVEFDGVSPSSIERHVQLVTGMKSEGLLGQVLVSHDAGLYRVGEPGGGEFRPFDTLFTTFVPALQKAGLIKSEVDRLLVDNPRRALAGA